MMFYLIWLSIHHAFSQKNVESMGKKSSDALPLTVIGKIWRY